MSTKVLASALALTVVCGCQPSNSDFPDYRYVCETAADCPPDNLFTCWPPGGGLCTRTPLVDAGVSPVSDARVRVDASVNSIPDASIRDARALSDAPTLSEGFVCTNDTQCAAGLFCALNAFTMTPQLSSCGARCDGNSDCGALGWCSNGACHRACDPIARDCPGAGTCQSAGGLSTPTPFVCALTVPAPIGVGGACRAGMFAGECGTGLTCAGGAVGANTCRWLCDVATDAGCTAPSDCVAFTPPVIAQGRNIGVCNP